MNDLPSNIDKRALRDAAEKALISRARLTLMESVFDDEGEVSPETQEDIRICVSFNDLTNPATVLTLLDELEARTLTVKLPEVRITVAESRRRNMTWRELGAYNEGADVAVEKISEVCAAAGITLVVGGEDATHA